jgi:dTDP-4-amino-4,6-dideoxy-D-galactose acyltransferase
MSSDAAARKEEAELSTQARSRLGTFYFYRASSMSTSRACDFSLLPWDSSLFGFPVARLHPECIYRGQLDQAISVMRAQQIQLAYATLPWNDVKSRESLSRLGISPVDQRVLFKKQITKSIEPTEKIEHWATSECPVELEELALVSGRFSRFCLDPQVPVHVFPQLYREWIRRSVRCEIAKAVFVTREQRALTGMVTVDISEDNGTIGLVAVADGHRGRGIGRALIAGAESFCAVNGAKSMSVATQALNHAACALYTSAGFRLAEVSAVYHLWVSKSAPG